MFIWKTTIIISMNDYGRCILLQRRKYIHVVDQRVWKMFSNYQNLASTSLHAKMFDRFDKMKFWVSYKDDTSQKYFWVIVSYCFQIILTSFCNLLDNNNSAPPPPNFIGDCPIVVHTLPRLRGYTFKSRSFWMATWWKTRSCNSLNSFTAFPCGDVICGKCTPKYYNLNYDYPACLLDCSSLGVHASYFWYFAVHYQQNFTMWKSCNCVNISSILHDFSYTYCAPNETSKFSILMSCDMAVPLASALLSDLFICWLAEASPISILQMCRINVNVTI